VLAIFIILGVFLVVSSHFAVSHFAVSNFAVKWVRVRDRDRVKG